MCEFNLNEDVNVGIHPFAEEKVGEFFYNAQKRIVNVFKAHWYITKADNVKIGASEYNYMLIKAPSNLANLFNLSAEIIVVFSHYEDFEPRTFDAFDNIKDKLELGRVESLCGVLISKDKDIESRLKYYNNGKETRIIIPYSYDELIENRSDSFIFRNKFQKYFYNRDLFAFDDALKTDLYFFGRNHIVMDIINRHLSGQNTGLFGLRKTGKTSIIYDVKRKIKYKSSIGVFISCQNPEMSTGSWVDSIFYIVKCIYSEMGEDTSILHRNDYSNLTAIENLVKEIKQIYDKFKVSLLLMFDEVEHITYGKAVDEKWGKGLESVSFWKAIRSAYQLQDSKFTYCIVGTNPICIEYPTITHADNPIFCGVEPLYIPGFDVEQTRSMVRKLGRIMGMKFDEILYAKMTEDYGGHPFLIRHVCSFISKKYLNRPVTIDRKKYNECKTEFNKTQGKYFDMLLEVLTEFYPIEYEMLKYLAMEDMETFNYFANEDFSMVQHLIGYGIISKIDDYYDFQIDVIREYLLQKENLSKKLISKEEKWSHLCSKRGNFEIEMRKMVKRVLFMSFSGNELEAKEFVMSKIYNDRESRRKYALYTFNDLFDPNKSLIYLKNLTTLILAKWQVFSPFMKDIKQEDFTNMMRILNVEGRFEAHAKIPDESDMVLFDAAITKLTDIMDEYNKIFL